MWLDLCYDFFASMAHDGLMFSWIAAIVAICIAAGVFTYIYRILDR